MDRAKLEALEKLLAGATPRPWFAEVSESDTCDWEVNAEEGKVAGEYGIESLDDAALIVAAVNALPALLRLARAVADAPRGLAWWNVVAQCVEVDPDNAKPQPSLDGKHVILLLADAADTTAGEG